MNLASMFQAILSTDLDAETRRALLRAAQGETGPEIDAALETLVRTLGLVDEAGAVREEGVNALLDDLGLEREND
ncbi:MAG: hypothetical protein ACP5HM_07955 [Anaerolineae bacterium]